MLLDGKALTFDVPPQLINNRTMVPLRAIFEAMGAKVDWDGDTETVTGTKDSTVVILKIGDTSPTINGTVVTIDQPGVIVNDRTLAPLRFVAEAFGGIVDWDDNTQTASITMGGAAATTPTATTTPTPTTQPPETTQPPDTTQPPSGNIDPKLFGVWAMGTSTKQIRTVLSGNYGDVKAFTFNGTGECYIFNSDGTYRNIVAAGGFSHMNITVIEGTYSLSNGKLTLSNRTAKKHENTGTAVVPITAWDSVSITSSVTHSIDFGVSIFDLDYISLDGNSVQYEKSES